MESTLLNVYHRLPPAARNAAATLRGWYLQRWRHSAVSGRKSDEAVAREYWSPAQWKAWRDERLSFVLHRAATRVPYYREQWLARRRRGDRSSWDVLEHWPVLEKDALRAHPRAFVADDCNPSRMYHEKTSGSTGKPIQVWRTRDTTTTLHAIVNTRTRAWDGIPGSARWARFGGQLVVPVRQQRPPFWVWNAAMHQLYMSSYHLAPELAPYYLEALLRYRIVYIAGYPSAIHALAQAALREGAGRDLTMAAVYTNAEPVLPEQREAIAAAFRCPVRESYGMTEAVAAGSECPAGRLHAWPEFGIMDREEDGDLICTGLLNADMPLIRYRVGDRGQAAPEGSCDCGRTLPLMGAIEGRTNDLLLTRDGRRVAWMSSVFYDVPVREWQIVQEQLDLLRVRVAPDPEFRRAHERLIVNRLRDRVGEVRVVVERVSEVPRINGKLRVMICALSAAERAEALGAAQDSET